MKLTAVHLVGLLALFPLLDSKPLQDKQEKQAPKDPYGMRMWQLALLKRGPEYQTPKGDARKKVFKGHFDNMERLSKLGKLRLAGPIAVAKDAPKDAYAGLFLLDVKTAKEARELCKTDPTIKAKVFEIEVLGWYGPSDITYRGDPNPPKKTSKK